jgi:hypothetical protein
MKNVRCGTSRTFITKGRWSFRKKELRLKEKVRKMCQSLRGLSEFEKGYRPSANLINDRNGDLFADSHKFGKVKELVCHLLDDVRQTKLHTAEPLVPEPISVEL